jgi:hypothetical protein
LFPAILKSSEKKNKIMKMLDNLLSLSIITTVILTYFILLPLGIYLAGTSVLGGAALGVALIATVVLFEESAIDDTLRPNEGIYRSLFTAVFTSVVVGAVGVAFGAGGGALLGVAAAAIIFGGRTVFQHYLLRILLWRSGRFPRNITAFLDWTAQRALVQRVGGGWRFVHRTLQERFAERYNEKRSTEGEVDPRNTT